MNNGDLLNNGLNTGLTALVVILVLFLLFRELICWYWKINKHVALLTEIRDLLIAHQHNAAGSGAGNPSTSSKIGPSGETLA